MKKILASREDLSATQHSEIFLREVDLNKKQLLAAGLGAHREKELSFAPLQDPDLKDLSLMHSLETFFPIYLGQIYEKQYNGQIHPETLSTAVNLLIEYCKSNQATDNSKTEY